MPAHEAEFSSCELTPGRTEMERLQDNATFLTARLGAGVALATRTGYLTDDPVEISAFTSMIAGTWLNDYAPSAWAGFAEPGSSHPPLLHFAWRYLEDMLGGTWLANPSEAELRDYHRRSWRCAMQHMSPNWMRG